MYYYEVLVGDLQYHGKSALTYASDESLLPGSVVRIALRSRPVLGLVLRVVPEPSFAAKSVAAVAPCPAVPHETLSLIEWLYNYYPAPFGTIVRQFLPRSTVFPKHSSGRLSVSNNQTNAKSLPPLTKDQTLAIAAIQSSGYHLLHGVTGSGKTRLYVELAKQTVAAGKSAIVLTPEIGLTAQLTEPFEQQFPGQVFVLHSRLTGAKRRDLWYEILASTEPVIVIGPRSALFTPVRALGLIVIDESHDPAYKSETAPYYRTERVAAKLAQLHKACLVSGSATPSVDEYYIASEKNRPIVALPNLALSSDASSETVVVDMRDRSFMNRSRIISQPLIDAMAGAFQRQEQALLFLNRRGTAAAVMCTMCGWQALCSHCDISLTYHGDVHKMRCHVCNRAWPLPVTCPECDATDIVLKTVGTKAIVEEIRRLFPNARIGRFDTDTAKADQLETQLQTLKRGEVDVIIGTQMVTKGLDLPCLSVVGVLNADSSLLIPDFTANERTYQLLAQVIGRAVRGHRASIIIVQTYNPTHTTILAALNKDWHRFYTAEITERRAYRFPPFVHLLKLHCARATSASAEKTAVKLQEHLEKTYPGLSVDGPSPSFHPREGGKYKWQLVVKASHRAALLDIIRNLPSGWTYDLDPVNLL